MLKLTNISKDYVTGDSTVTALRGVSLEFRKNEFVAILGHSGCGKTTLLNIIGGLDKYTSGDLIINGKSTKDFTDRDWDTYRNHSIGFVFQSYNLIPHQTVLSNVELALTLSGVSKEERRKRAIEALESVGLGDQIHKKPNQMSGGQMQRVAIARALVNDPDILMADEPTGALDSETSVQIMEILKEISKDKLIIMVTHNPELADEYANRIIRLKDGEIDGDTNPYISEDIASTEMPTATESEQASELDERLDSSFGKSAKSKKKAKEKRTKGEKKKSMSFITALTLSLNNLLTKKGRTFLTAFAGSIGIIGIALILSVSTGVNNYIDSVEESTMASYPIEIQSSSVDMMSLIGTIMETPKIENKQPDTVYSNDVMINVMSALSAGRTENNLEKFKDWLDTNETIKENATDIKYRYDAGLNTYTIIKDANSNISHRANLADVSTLMSLISSTNIQESSGSSINSVISSSVWREFVGDMDHVKSQYNLVENGGRFPENENEVVLIVNNDLLITDFVLYMLGLRDYNELKNYLTALYNPNTAASAVPPSSTNYTFEDVLGLEFKIIPDSEKFILDELNGEKIARYREISEIEFDKFPTLKVVGIVTPSDESASKTELGSIGYMPALMDKMMEISSNSEIIKLQQQTTDHHLFDGRPFGGYEPYLGSVTEEGTVKYAIYQTNPLILAYLQTDEQIISAFQSYLTADKKFNDVLANAPWGGFTVDDIAMLCEHLTKISTNTNYDQLTQAVASLYLEQAKGNPENFLKLVNELLPMNSHENALIWFGYVNKSNPNKILIYPKDFDAKDTINSEIKAYNERQTKEDQITYSDMIGMLLSSVTTIVNAITYVLVAFVAISLIVSSIMIGIITYISVLERTKEIGILRSIGASKKDVSRVFNAETLIVGFAAGVIGIVVTLFFNFIINIILDALTGIEALKATLPPLSAIELILISMGLTLIAGLVPSRIAAKKDPVIALRSE